MKVNKYFCGVPFNESLLQRRVGSMGQMNPSSRSCGVKNLFNVSRNSFFLSWKGTPFIPYISRQLARDFTFPRISLCFSKDIILRMERISPLVDSETMFSMIPEKKNS